MMKTISIIFIIYLNQSLKEGTRLKPAFKHKKNLNKSFK